MRNKHFLFTPSGRSYLDEEYNAKERSTYDIAQEQGSYPNLVRRALLHHGYKLRTRSDAQKLALQQERHPHPTQGKQHPNETKSKIRESVTRARRKVEDERREDDTDCGRGSSPGCGEPSGLSA